MSEWGGIIDAVQAIAPSHFSGIVAVREVISAEEAVSKNPRTIMGFGTPSNADLEVFHQELRSIAAGFLLVIQKDATWTQEGTYTAFDALRTAINADRTLGGIVDRCLVSDWVAEESADVPYRLLGFTVTAEVTK